MNVLGIVLAAGQSTRLGNKCLLPDKHGRVILGSAVRFCERFCDSSVLVHNGGPVEAFCWRCRDPKVTFIHHVEPKGVVSSIWAGIAGRKYDRVLVAFADNIYSLSEQVDMTQDCASVRELYGPIYEQLDGWLIDQWVDRSKKPWKKFAGWLSLSAEAVGKLVGYDDLIEGMNKVGVKPVERTNEWWDIGTPESYAAYMEDQPDIAALVAVYLKAAAEADEVCGPPVIRVDANNLRSLCQAWEEATDREKRAVAEFNRMLHEKNLMRDKLAATEKRVAKLKGLLLRALTWLPKGYTAGLREDIDAALAKE